MRIVAALSGGVDSAVAAARLVREGADVVGVYLRTGVEAEDEDAPSSRRTCCGADDARDARAVAARLGIPFYAIDVSAAFSRDVVGGFVASYAAGRTPNPCVECNRAVKFGRLLDVARSLGAGALATGHYARTAPREDGGVRLLRAADARKDQSYVLYALSQEALRAARFPVGASTKAEVRAEARALALPVAEKPDSQELCFVPAGDHRAVLRERVPDSFRPGPVEDGDGRPLGSHGGAAGFTVGQRRGLGVAAAEPLYVTSVDVARNAVAVGPRSSLLRRTVAIEHVRWLERAPDDDGTPAALAVEARIRHGQPPAPARLHRDPSGGARGSRWLVEFETPVFAPAPGQALVAYRGDVVVCGGPIASSAAQAGAGRPDGSPTATP
jgi:tRNA-specific 2-thiouridylase